MCGGIIYFEILLGGVFVKKNLFLCVMALFLAAAVLLSSSSGAVQPAAAKTVQSSENNKTVSSIDFALGLLSHQWQSGENTVLSPLCASSALTAAALGASGDTRTQLESILTDNGNLNALASSLGAALSDSDGAVSLWLRNDGRLTLSESYLSAVGSTLDAQVSLSDFGPDTVEGMNRWVSDVTDGRVDSLINDIPPDACLYILSALSFDGEWAVPYSENSIREGEFTSSDGTVYAAEFMGSTENIYLETELAAGFAKPYSDGSYFVALLPDENVSMSDLLSSLDGDTFREMMAGAQTKSISVQLPKFESESRLSLCDSIISMGAPDAFSQAKADFSALGAQPQSAYISDFLLNSSISVDEKGTEGGAGAGIEVTLKGMPATSLRFDRPFVYFVIRDDVILFAGVLERI